jgi:RNA polymerase sigma-70 factor (ECF subfamily)
MVRGIVLRGLGRSAEIEDVTQEIFLRVFDRIETLQKPQALRPFVASFAIRIVKWERRKRRQARRWITLTATGLTPDRRGDEPLRYDVWDAWRLCDQLGARQRDVVLLKYVEEMTLPEIAQALALSIPTIKRALRLARDNITSLHQAPVTRT